LNVKEKFQRLKVKSLHFSSA